MDAALKESRVLFIHGIGEIGGAERELLTIASIVVEITQGTTFYPAEDFHQNYYQTNPLRYKFYRLACGRDSRLAELWGDA